MSHLSDDEKSDGWSIDTFRRRKFNPSPLSKSPSRSAKQPDEKSDELDDRGDGTSCLNLSRSGDEKQHGGSRDLSIYQEDMMFQESYFNPVNRKDENPGEGSNGLFEQKGTHQGIKVVEHENTQNQIDPFAGQDGQYQAALGAHEEKPVPELKASKSAFLHPSSMHTPRSSYDEYEYHEDRKGKADKKIMTEDLKAINKRKEEKKHTVHNGMEFTIVKKKKFDLIYYAMNNILTQKNIIELNLNPLEEERCLTILKIVKTVIPLKGKQVAPPETPSKLSEAQTKLLLDDKRECLQR